VVVATKYAAMANAGASRSTKPMSRTAIMLMIMGRFSSSWKVFASIPRANNTMYQTAILS
jgi:hypothetical protein